MFKRKGTIMFWNKKKKFEEESETWTKKSANPDPKYTKIETGSVMMIDHTKSADEDDFLHLYSRTNIDVSDLSANGARDVALSDVVKVSAAAIVQQVEQIANSLAGSAGYQNAPQEDIDAMKYNVALFAFKQITKDTGINAEFFDDWEDEDD
jgi:hypothetical protein